MDMGKEVKELEQGIRERLRILEETRQNTEKEYARIEGMMEGLRAGKLSETDKKILFLTETLAEISKIGDDEFIGLSKIILSIIGWINNNALILDNLYKRIEKLENTLDTLSQMK